MAAGGCWFCAFVVQLRSVACLYISNKIPLMYDRVCNEYSNWNYCPLVDLLLPRTLCTRNQKRLWSYVSNIDISIAMTRRFRNIIDLATRITATLK